MNERNDRIDYWFWKKFFNKKKIIEINNLIEKNFHDYQIPEKGALNVNNEPKKNSLVKVVSWKIVKNLLHDIHVKAIDSARKNFGYNVYEMSEEDTCLLNIYSSNNNSKYDWHTDGSGSNLYDCKLTVLINLSLNSYEGGDFKLFNNNEYLVNELKDPGNVIIFKSNINHCVTPITKGERRTLTMFILGPRFK